MMKKYLLFVGIALLATLQSCSMYSETTFHKDAASTTQIDFDFKEAMLFAKSMTPDSAQDDQKLQDLESLPKVWTSFYDMKLKDGKKITNQDSVKVMKKMFMKSNFDGKDLAGMSMKFDHFTKADYDFLDKIAREDKIPFSKHYKDWNGKSLTIDTKRFNLGTLEELFNEREKQDEDGPLSKEELKEKAEQVKMMMNMMNMKITDVMRFETKIKSVTGKHDWIQQLDDYTIKISFTSSDLVDDDKKLINTDEKIVIVTE